MVGEGGNYINVNCTYLLAPFLRIARNATFETISCEGNLILKKYVLFLVAYIIVVS